MRSPLAILAALAFLASQVFAQEVRRALPAAEPDSPDSLAKFLAGVPLPEDSPLAALQKSSAYKEHVGELAQLSQHYDKTHFAKMRAWSATELAPLIPMDRPVIYFFGGPDSVSPLAYYPDAPVYILGGLESVGSIASPETLTPQAVTEGLDNLRKSTQSILSFGHFITKDMKAELDLTAFRGVYPVILTFLAMANADVLSATYVGIQSDGSLQESSGPVESKGVLPGIRIVFRRGPQSSPQTLYYIQANVVDDSLKSNGALLKWTSSFGPGNVYLKAASYLMHEEYFSRIRSFLLSDAISVLQDDSGIPFKYFQDGQWRCWLFGSYTGTLDIFKKYYQPDYANAYTIAGGVLPIPFGTGYKWREGQSNLLLAVRQQVPRAEPAN
ncbi:hypothetical protein BH09VER1_BH09VER1_06060 [soil metagenome]